MGILTAPIRKAVTSVLKTLGATVIVQSVTTTADARGGLPETWAQFASPKASVNPLSGSEQFIERRLRGEVTAEILIPYQAGVNETMRVLTPREDTTAAAAIDDSETSITVASATGFPTGQDYRIKIDDELMEVTAGHGTTTWTVTRGVDGTTAAAHSSGAKIERMGIYNILAVINVGGISSAMQLLARGGI